VSYLIAALALAGFCALWSLLPGEAGDAPGDGADPDCGDCTHRIAGCSTARSPARPAELPDPR
jgi:hypothetical protein